MNVVIFFNVALIVVLCKKIDVVMDIDAQMGSPAQPGPSLVWPSPIWPCPMRPDGYFVLGRAGTMDRPLSPGLAQ